MLSLSSIGLLLSLLPSLAASQTTFLSASQSPLTLSSAYLSNNNTAARFLRTAQSYSPSSKQGGGSPQYTFGAQNNTPPSPIPPTLAPSGGNESSDASGRYTLFQPSQWTSGFFSQGERNSREVACYCP